MVEEEGTVLKIEGEVAFLRAERSGACDSCTTREACESTGGSEMRVEATNTIGAKVGDRVAFTVSPSELLKAGVVLYLVPLLGFMGGVVMGQVIAAKFLPGTDADLLSAVLGFVLLLFTYGVIKVVSARADTSGIKRPRVTRIIKSAG